MGESVDAHFLLLAMRHGLVVPIVLSAAIIYGVVRLGLVLPSLEAKDRKLSVGLNISIVNLVVVGQTVNYFGSANLIFMAIIGFLASAVSIINEKSDFNRRQRIRQMYQAVPRVAA